MERRWIVRVTVGSRNVDIPVEAAAAELALFTVKRSLGLGTWAEVVDYSGEKHLIKVEAITQFSAIKY